MVADLWSTCPNVEHAQSITVFLGEVLVFFGVQSAQEGCAQHCLPWLLYRI